MSYPIGTLAAGRHTVSRKPRAPGCGLRHGQLLDPGHWDYDSAVTINVGVGEDLTIRELAVLVADVVGYEGELVQDPTKPDGMHPKLLDVSRINDLGWKATIPLRDGIATTYKWFVDHMATLRS